MAYLRYHTHIATSIAAGAGVAITGDASFTFPYVVGIAIGALLPDIDEPNSYIGRRSLGLAKVIKSIFGHRGITHSILASGLIFYLHTMYDNDFTLGIAYGYAFHILGDFFSKRGVPFFSPLSKKKFKPPLTYETGSGAETLIFYLAVIGSFYMLYKYQLYTQLF
ncbi:metal-dependent hydrolase [Priestia megaterium]|uniref:metal-dependent hydrolase n=1 Tax=Priestia megaterium TaxID=1404 RepID=UPI001FAE930E|nr:metal-dependent hydrolase [Priestia megaterium]